MSESLIFNKRVNKPAGFGVVKLLINVILLWSYYMNNVPRKSVWDPMSVNTILGYYLVTLQRNVHHRIYFSGRTIVNAADNSI